MSTGRGQLTAQGSGYAMFAPLWLTRRPIKVVGIRPLGLYRYDIPLAQRTARSDVHFAVDFGRIALRAPNASTRARLVDNHPKMFADLFIQPSSADFLRQLHKPPVAGLLNFKRNKGQPKIM